MWLEPRMYPRVPSAGQNVLAFWLYGGFCILGIIVVFLFVPETKGKSLETIEAELISGK